MYEVELYKGRGNVRSYSLSWICVLQAWPLITGHPVAR